MKGATLALLVLYAGHGLGADGQDFELDVAPVLCITSQRSPSCYMDFSIEWRGASTADYCVSCSLVDGPLRCWDDESQGTLRDPRTVTQSFDYWLAHSGTSDTLVEVAVKVRPVESSDRRRSRRKRHVWSVW